MADELGSRKEVGRIGEETAAKLLQEKKGIASCIAIDPRVWTNWISLRKVEINWSLWKCGRPAVTNTGLAFNPSIFANSKKYAVWLLQYVQNRLSQLPLRFDVIKCDLQGWDESERRTCERASALS
jgi:hypothetical protein